VLQNKSNATPKKLQTHKTKQLQESSHNDLQNLILENKSNCKNTLPSNLHLVAINLALVIYILFHPFQPMHSHIHMGWVVLECLFFLFNVRMLNFASTCEPLGGGGVGIKTPLGISWASGSLIYFLCNFLSWMHPPQFAWLSLKFDSEACIQALEGAHAPSHSHGLSSAWVFIFSIQCENVEFCINIWTLGGGSWHRDPSRGYLRPSVAWFLFDVIYSHGCTCTIPSFMVELEIWLWSLLSCLRGCHAPSHSQGLSCDWLLIFLIQCENVEFCINMWTLGGGVSAPRPLQGSAEAGSGLILFLCNFLS
jgi:hypothetical protein